jgi:hypothetical protein
LPLRGEAEHDAIFRLCDSYIAAFSFLSIPYGLHATFSVSNKRKGELIMANMDEVSRSIWAFGIVAAIWIVLLIVVAEPWGQTVTRLLGPEGLLVGITHTPSMRT